MAEAAGLVVGGVGLIAMFDSAMNAFHYIESGASYGKEYEKAALKLALLQRKLSNWRQTVTLVDEPGVGSVGPRANAEEVQELEHLLGQIQYGFEEAENASKRYKPRPGTSTSVTDAEKQEADRIERAIRRVKSVARERQKSASLVDKTTWALRDQRRFERLINEQTEFIDSLIQLFPGTLNQQLAMVKRDAEALVTKEELRTPTPEAEILQEASQEVWPELKASFAAVADGHQFLHIVNSGEAKVQNGNIVSGNYQGKFSGQKHRYENVDSRDKASVLNGDVYSSGKVKTVFDD